MVGTAWLFPAPLGTAWLFPAPLGTASASERVPFRTPALREKYPLTTVRGSEGNEGNEGSGIDHAALGPIPLVGRLIPVHPGHSCECAQSAAGASPGVAAHETGRIASCPFREKLIESPRIRAASCGA